TFYSRFLEAAERAPQAVALEMQRRDRLEQVTYSELRQSAATLAAWLRNSGRQPGDRIALLAGNSPRWVAAYLGALAAGCIAVPLDTAFHAGQVATLLRDSGSVLLFSDAQHFSIARDAAQGLALELALLEGSPPGSGPGAQAAFSTTLVDEILASGPREISPFPSQPGDTAAILYTSGTTADPKGVMLTQANLVGELEGALGIFDVGPGDAILGVLPLFHALAQMANLLVPLAVGARIVYLETLNTTELLRALRERDITLFCCVPQFFYLIHERMLKEIGRHGLAARLGFRALLKTCRAARALGVNPGKLIFRRVHQMLGSRMRYLITGGSRFDPQVGRDLYALGFQILQAYGLTETTGGATCTPPGSRAIGSVGPPLPGVEVKLLDPQPPEDGAGPAIGEVAIRGPIVMRGYHHRPDATAAVLQEGWLRTGDLGYLDPNGNLFITGRRKEIIVLSSGKNIYPEEIENHYLHSPFIGEICVMGLESRPGEPYAEKLHAVVVPNFDVLRERKIVNTREVIRFDIESLSAQMPASKRILSYEIWQRELPRTTTRKLKRFEIEQRVRQQQQSGQLEEEGGAAAEPPPSAQDQVWLESPQVQRALQIVRQESRSGSPEIRPADNLELDLGLDSIQRVELLMALQQEFGAHLPESLMSEVYTVRELVDRVLAAAGSAGAEARTGVDWNSVLQADAPDEFVLAAIRRRPLGTALGYLLAKMLQIFFQDRFRLRISGLEKLPQSGPCLICPNHQSFLDPIVLACVLPWPLFRDAFSLGTTEIFGSILPRRAARLLKVVPVDPDSALVSAMRAGAYGLRRGKVLVLFPEGERSIDGVPRNFKKGAAILATHLRVPIVPVAMDGFYEVWPRGKKYQGPHPLRIAFGDPLLPPAGAAGGEDAYTALTADLKARILKMWEQLHASSLPAN
ncbi:MAG TPA: AMP-binding protein, partial [Terriglobales bacterium]|nr:AMP-binding protein [Terriglobales bacterium]